MSAKPLTATEALDAFAEDRWSSEYADPAELLAHPRNPRTHSPDQIEELRALIREFGFTNPPLLRADGRLIAGHARTQAAMLEGLVRVPIRRRKPGYELTEAQELALVVADNKSAEHAGWDDALLAGIMTDLRAAEFDLSLTGFSVPEIGDLLERAGLGGGGTSGSSEKGGPDELPSSAPPRVREGDIWRLGPHVVMCGDSFDEATRLRLLEEAGRPSMVLTDPPYAIYGSSSGIASDIADDKMVRPFFEALGRACASSIPWFGHVYIFTDWRSWSAVWEGMKRSGLSPKNCLVWDKGSFGLGANWPNAHEFVGFFTKIPPHGAMTSKRPAGQRQVLDHANILRYPRVAGAERLHNAAKPVALLELVIEKASDPGAVVLDLFGGSGSTLIAADSKGRRCAMMEMDPRTCDVILARWERKTGETAERLEIPEEGKASPTEVGEAPPARTRAKRSKTTSGNSGESRADAPETRPAGGEK